MENVPGLSLLPFVVSGAAVILYIFRMEVVLIVRMTRHICTCAHISVYKGILKLEVMY